MVPELKTYMDLTNYIDKHQYMKLAEQWDKSQPYNKNLFKTVRDANIHIKWEKLSDRDTRLLALQQQERSRRLASFVANLVVSLESAVED